MNVFNLPPSTFVNKIIPKNAFDKYTNTKQKKEMTDLIAKILWSNKLSRTTVNLESTDIEEIQVITIELKEKADISELLDIIDKASPYCIIFVITYNGDYYISTSAKHTHPTKPDTSVLDWTFKSGWFEDGNFPYKLNLAKSLDATYLNFCLQLSGVAGTEKTTMPDLVKKRQEIAQLEKEISKLNIQINNCKQFNIKVELNLKRNDKFRKLQVLLQDS